MYSDLRKLGKNLLVYGLGGMLQRFMGLLLLPFFTRVLTPEDYGVVALVSLIGGAMSGLFTLGTGNSMGILYFRGRDLARRPTIIWSNVLLLTLNAIFWYSIAFVSAQMLSTLMFQSDRYADLIRLALLASVFSAISDPWLAYLRMEEKARRYVIITLISSFITIGFSVWFVLVQGIGVRGIILATTLSQGVMLGFIWLVVGRQLPFSVDTTLFRPLVRIGFPSIFGLLAFFFIDYADRQIIERLAGLDALGVYSVGYSFGMVISIAMGAFSTAWPPFFMSYLNKPEEARIIFSRVLTYYLIVFGSLTVLFFFAAKPLVLLTTSSVFHEAHLVVGLVAASYILKGCYLIVLPGMYFAEKLYKQAAVEWVAAIINIGMNLLLIPRFGITGAALATFISYLSLPILAGLVARQYLVVDYNWRRLFKISFAVVSACGFLYFISSRVGLSLFSTILINFFILLSFFGIGYYLLITDHERETMLSKF